MARRDASKLQFDALQIEGALIQPDVVAKVAAGDAWQQTDESYGVLPGLKLRDEIGRFTKSAALCGNGSTQVIRPKKPMRPARPLHATS